MPTFSAHVSTFRSQLIEALLPLYPALEAEMITRILSEYLLELDWYLIRRDEDVQFESYLHPQAQRLADRLLLAEPVQYVIGQTDFLGRTFLVNPAVLIPRQETEELVDWIRGTLISSGLREELLRGVDVGTGSGIIPITLELEMKKWGVSSLWTGIDVSSDALAVAQSNARELRASTQWLEQDILQAQPDQFQELQALVSNPPYVPLREGDQMHRNVREYEPDLALFVPNDDPLRFFRVIGELGRNWLAEDGFLFAEGHMDHLQTAAKLWRSQGYREVEVKKDLSGRDRMIRARK
ncbi:MAG: HemK/PrmC family methyltransferase [Bacteroidota bacterium]